MQSPAIAIAAPFSFLTDGETTAATLWLPADTREPAPAVVTGPGFGGVKEMLIPAFAEAVAARGIACLAFDPIGFGASGGTRRQHVDPAQQLRAFAAALEALAANDRIDGARLGVFGTSLSGGHTLRCAAELPRVRCAAALIPFIAFRNRPPLAIARRTTTEALRLIAGRPDRLLPIAGEEGTVAAMTGDGAEPWMQAVAAAAPTFRNEVTVGSLLNMTRYSTSRAARALRVPTLVVVAEDDTITPAAQVRRAVRGNPAVTLKAFPESHFELFDERLSEVTALTADFLAEHLQPER